MQTEPSTIYNLISCKSKHWFTQLPCLKFQCQLSCKKKKKSILLETITCYSTKGVGYNQPFIQPKVSDIINTPDIKVQYIAAKSLLSTIMSTNHCFIPFQYTWISIYSKWTGSNSNFEIETKLIIENIKFANIILFSIHVCTA